MRYLTMLLFCFAGCAMDVATPARTEQDLATQGTKLDVYIWNTGTPDNGGLLWAQGVSTSGIQTFQAGDTSGEGGHAGNLVIANVTITTGGTTPSATGTTTASSATTQRVDPEITGSLPVAIAPGGIADATGTTAGSGSTATSSMEKRLDARIANLEAQNASMLDMLKTIMEATPMIIDVPE